MDTETRQALKAAILGLSRDTRRTLQPVLHLPAVQQLLVTLLQDKSREFEDWIRDGQTQSIVHQLAAMMSPSATPIPGISDMLTEEYQAATEHRAVLESSGLADRRPVVLMEVQRLRENAKEHFRQQRYHTSRKLYESAIELCAEFSNEGDGSLNSLVATLYVNFAICSHKCNEWPAVLDACTAALRHDAGNLKALYWRAKYHMSNCTYEFVIDDLEALLVLDAANTEATELLAVARTKLREQRSGLLMAKYEKDANLAQWQAKKSGAHLPQSKKEFLEEVKSQLDQSPSEQLAKPTSMGPGMPRPPALNSTSKTPTVLLQQYISLSPNNKVEIWDEPCQLPDRKRGFKCIIKQVGVACASGVDTSKKKAKQRAALEFLQQLYPVYMERNPKDRPFLEEEMRPLPEMLASLFPVESESSAPQTSATNLETAITEGETKEVATEAQVAEVTTPPAPERIAEAKEDANDTNKPKRSKSHNNRRNNRHRDGSHATKPTEDDRTQNQDQPRRFQSHPRTTATPEFHKYTAAWIDEILNGRYNRLIFPAGLRPKERNYIIEYVFYHPESRKFGVNIARFTAGGKEVTKLKSVVVTTTAYQPRLGVMDSMDVPPPPYLPDGFTQRLINAKASVPAAIVQRKWVVSEQGLAETEAAPKLTAKQEKEFEGYLNSWTALLLLRQARGVKFPKSFTASYRAHVLRWSKTNSFLNARVEAKVQDDATVDHSVLRLVVELNDSVSDLRFISAPDWN